MEDDSLFSRRRVIYATATLGVVGAGCLGNPDAPTAENVGFDASVESQPTESRPARVGISMTNESDRKWRYPVWPPDLDTDNRVPFDACSATGESGAKLFLIPDFDEYMAPEAEDVPLVPTSPTDGCWRAGYDNLVQADIGTQYAALEPGETFQETYSVLGAAGSDCSERDEFEFTARKSVEADETTSSVTLSANIRIAGDGTVSVPTTDVVVSRSTSSA